MHKPKDVFHAITTSTVLFWDFLVDSSKRNKFDPTPIGISNCLRLCGEHVTISVHFHPKSSDERSHPSHAISSASWARANSLDMGVPLEESSRQKRVAQ